MDKDAFVWKFILELMEMKMKEGELIILDATNLKLKDLTSYRKLAEKYRYRICVIDFTNVPLETCLERNRSRPQIQFVPEDTIKRYHDLISTEKLPNSFKVVKPEDLSLSLNEKIDLSSYKKIIHFGDIHGCYDTLMKYFEAQPFNKEYAYIFCGDYLDRGNQNAEVFKFLDSIKDCENVCLLSGNHERWLENYANDIDSFSNEFKEKTLPQLEQAGINKSTVKNFIRKLKQCSYYTYQDKEFLVCHGGIPNLPADKILSKIKTKDLIFGVGDYKDGDEVEDTWYANFKGQEIYQVHGHRNVNKKPLRVNKNVFNLEGAIEFNGELRILEVSVQGFNCITIQSVETNKNLKLEYKENKQKFNCLSDEQIILSLRSNDCIRENKLSDYISSFNFTKEAFFDKNWDNQTVLARGLFINTKENKILARSYEKFFRINERPETTLKNLKNTLKFPLKAYFKYDGFLGIVSYDWTKDELFFASKSTNKSDHAGYLKEILEKTNVKLDKLKEYLKKTNRTAVFEIIDPENDIHIIEYKEKRAILLDLIDNSFKFKKQNYQSVLDISYLINCPAKKAWSETIMDYDCLCDFLVRLRKNNQLFDNKLIEGFVLEDKTGFMLKAKTLYYDFWKAARSYIDYYVKTGVKTQCSYLDTNGPIFKKYINFVEDNFDSLRELDFIQKRKKFFEKYPDLNQAEIDNFLTEFTLENNII